LPDDLIFPFVPPWLPTHIATRVPAHHLPAGKSQALDIVNQLPASPQHPHPCSAGFSAQVTKFFTPGGENAKKVSGLIAPRQRLNVCRPFAGREGKRGGPRRVQKRVSGADRKKEKGKSVSFHTFALLLFACYLFMTFY
jgi:hypothetical protein